MKTLKEELEIFRHKVLQVIGNGVDILGEESEFSDERVLKLPGNLNFNLEWGGYVVEVGSRKGLNQDGYYFDLLSLSDDNLVEIADWIRSRYS